MAAMDQLLLAAPAEFDPIRVAIITDGVGVLSESTDTLTQLHQRGIVGHEIDLIGAGPTAGQRRSVVVEALTQRHYDLVHVCTPSPLGITAVLIAGASEVPTVATYDTDLSASVHGAFYRQCRVVLSPGRFADESLAELGIGAGQIVRWEPGVDLQRFGPARYATFLGSLQGDELARVYASADLFVFPSSTDAFGQAILEAQASGLPVLAVDAGGPAELIESGRSGCLVPPDPEALGSALRGLARRTAMLDRLATGGLVAIRERSWEHSLRQLASAYQTALAGPLGGRQSQATEAAGVTRAA